VYRIKTGQRLAAQRLGVVIRPSTVKNKKLDVYKNGIKIASIGAVGYLDYWTYLQDEKFNRAPKGTAAQRRRLYKIRHANECAAPGTVGYYACKILW
jgi:uncharacterized membrane protein YebE (DUF533 family)